MGWLFGKTDNKQDHSSQEIDNSTNIGDGANTGTIDNSDNSVTNVLDGGAIEKSFDFGSLAFKEANDTIQKNSAGVLDTVNTMFSKFTEATTENDKQVGEVIGSSFQAIGKVSSDLSEAMSSETARMTENISKWLIGGVTVVTGGGIIFAIYKAVKK